MTQLIRLLHTSTIIYKNIHINSNITLQSNTDTIAIKDSSGDILISDNNKIYIQKYDINQVMLPTTPVYIYINALKDKFAITHSYLKVSGIYLWHNNVTGEQYVGSGYNLSKRLHNYYHSKELSLRRPISVSIGHYGHNNFSLVVLETFPIQDIPYNSHLLTREQYYIDTYNPKLNVNKFIVKPTINAFNNKAVVVYSDKTRQYMSDRMLGTKNQFYGMKHTEEALRYMSAIKKGTNNPMYNKPKSPEFMYWTTKDRTGSNNPMYGKPKSPETLLKLRKPIYVYDVTTWILLKTYPGLLIAAQETGIPKTSLRRYMMNFRVYEGRLYTPMPIELLLLGLLCIHASINAT